MTPPQTQTQNQRFDELKEELDEITRILRGSNGNVGLVAKVDSLNSKIEEHVALERKCPALDVVDTLRGTLSTPGLIETVRELVRWKSNTDRMTWLMISTMVVSVINIIITISADILIGR